MATHKLHWISALTFGLCFATGCPKEDSSDEGNDSKISINPRGVKILANTQGFFIAQSADEVKR